MDKKTKIPSFSNNKQTDFALSLRQNVMAYFEENGISKYGNINMALKTIFMFSLYLVPYFIMISGVTSNPFLLLLLWMIMGLGVAGIGLSVMHDANHNSYSRHPVINRILSYSLNFLGGFSLTWQYQHNTLHHFYTNINGFDEDIDPGIVLRLSPQKPLYKFHRFQQYYAWFLYALMTLTWTIDKDFKQLFHYKREGVILNSKKSFNALLAELIISKLIYYTYILIIPILVLPVAWWVILIYYLVMHFISGFILAVIFQTAHVMPSSEYPEPDKQGSMENNWTIHQLLTTNDYSPKSRFFSWFIGGLNYQIEHHLFPSICHVHYKKIAHLVEQTAREYQLPYYVQPNFLKALANHKKMLRILGR